MGTLNIYAVAKNQSSLVWTQNGNQGLYWLNGRVTIQSSRAFRIVIESVRGYDATSNIAIDDIDFVEKSCTLSPASADPQNQVTITAQTTTRSLRPQSDLDCDFEKDLCIWSSSGKHMWTRAQGQRGSQVTGPLYEDHSTGSPEGWYIFADLARTQMSDTVPLVSTDLSSRNCLEFYYYFSTNIKFAFGIFIRVDNQDGAPLWVKSSTQGNLWHLGRVTIGSQARQYKVLISVSGVQNASPLDVIALDDIFIRSGQCMDSAEPNQVCTFADPGTLCGYTVNNSTKFQWAYYAGVDADPKGRLPLVDHTTDGFGTGYMYADSRGFKVNDTATISSPMYAPRSSNRNDTERCVEFYFYVTGNRTIQLSLFMILQSKLEYFLWSRDGMPSFNWWRGQAQIKYNLNFTIEFRAIAQSEPDGAIAAIDDIVMRDGKCFGSTSMCDFDNRDLCSWSNFQNNDFDWTLKTGSTPTTLTGPSYDHTQNNIYGYYAYIETTNVQENAKASLLSEPLDNKEPGCLQFWYHMYGDVS